MAMNLSIGYIITIVLGVIILIFGMQFIFGTFSTMNQITDYISNKAQQDMINSLRNADDVVSTTFPKSTTGTEVPKNSIVSFNIGVKKTNQVEDINTFSLNIASTTGTMPTGIKFTYRDRINIIERDDIKLTQVDMTVQQGIELMDENTFGFVVYVCKGSVIGCNLDSPEYYGDSDFILHVK